MSKAPEPAKAPNPVKCIVRKGWTFHDAWRGYEAGEIVTVDKSKMTLAENLRELTAAERRMKPSELKIIELGEDEKPADDEELPAEEAA